MHGKPLKKEFLTNFVTDVLMYFTCQVKYLPLKIKSYLKIIPIGYLKFPTGIKIF